MSNFHGANKRHSFFEGWYLKHQNNNRTLAFIPSFHIDEEGNPSALLQVITEKMTYSKRFSADAFSASKSRFRVNLGENRFTEHGVYIEMEEKDFSISGHLRYTDLTPPLSNVMGPFRFVPFMQCNHGVVSLTHRISGSIKLNDQILDFNDGVGYIEKDWGTSFPVFYLWTQCNWYDERQDNSIMLSVANIPFLKRSFMGTICSIFFQGEEYRLATYYGAKILHCSEREVVIVQKDLRLEAFRVDDPLDREGHPLKAPQNGAMGRMIHERPACTVNYRFLLKDTLIFDLISDQASYEFVNDTDENGDDSPLILYAENIEAATEKE